MSTPTSDELELIEIRDLLIEEIDIHMQTINKLSNGLSDLLSRLQELANENAELRSRLAEFEKNQQQNP